MQIGKKSDNFSEADKQLFRQLAEYKPWNEQEERDLELLKHILQGEEQVWTRNNSAMHLTASGWVVSPDRMMVLMAYHNIYQSWSWLGGHADGSTDLLQTAVREVREESCLENIRIVSPDIFSLEILTVNGHQKSGRYVSCHLHLNITYLLEADPNEYICHREGENSAVSWFTAEKAVEASSEPWFQEHIYTKLNEKVKRMFL